MLKYGRGAIVNTSSGERVKGFGGVVGLGKSAALDDAGSNAASFVLGMPWSSTAGKRPSGSSTGP
jgi:hypothetical protein